MDLSRESFTNKKSSSLLYYTPKSQMDYGTVLCVASNVVGRQIVPCIYHVIPAGMTQWVQTNSGSAIGILCTCIFTRFSKKNHPATIVCTEIQGNISWKCWSMKIRGCLQNWFHCTLIDMKIKVVWFGISWSYILKNDKPVCNAWRIVSEIVKTKACGVKCSLTYCPSTTLNQSWKILMPP